MQINKMIFFTNVVCSAEVGWECVQMNWTVEEALVQIISKISLALSATGSRESPLQDLSIPVRYVPQCYVQG